MKKPTKKAVGIGVAVVSIIAAAGTTVAVKRQKSKSQPPKQENPQDEVSLFI